MTVAVMRVGWQSGLPPAGQVVEVWYTSPSSLPCGLAANGAPQTGNGWQMALVTGDGGNRGQSWENQREVFV